MFSKLKGGKLRKTLNPTPLVLVDLLLIRLRNQHQVKLSCLFVEVTSTTWAKNAYCIVPFLYIVTLSFSLQV